MPTSPVRIHLRRTGGIAGVGVQVAADLDSLELSDDNRTILRSLEHEPPDEPSDTDVLQPRGADRFSYELTVTGSDGARHYTWSEAELPNRLRGAVEELAHLARPVPRSRPEQAV